MCFQIFPTLFFLLVTIPLVLITTLNANASSIHLLADNPETITLKFTLPDFKLQTNDTLKSPCQQIDITGWATAADPGYPEIPVTGTLIQVPPTGTISHTEEIKYETVSEIELCPKPTPIASEQGEINYVFFKDESAYQNQYFWPNAWLEIGERQVLRGVHVSRVQIFPFRWNPLTKELYYLTEMVLHVQFENALPDQDNRTRSKTESFANSYEALLQDIVINYQTTLSSPNFYQTTKRRLRNEEAENAVSNEENEQEEPFIRQTKSSDTLKIEITQEGIYRLSYEQLTELGLHPQFINPTKLHLFHQGEEVAIKVSSEQAEQFNPGDYIEFYGQSINTIFTETNVYWLYWRKREHGKRVAQIAGQPNDTSEPITTFYDHLHLEKNGQFWLGTPGAPEQDYWFWQRLNASETGKYSFELSSLPSTPTEAVMRVGFRGRSTATPHPNHHTIIKLNDTVIGDEHWDGATEFVQEMAFSSELLKTGENQLHIEMPGDTGAIVDVIYFNWVELNYWRNLEATKDTLRFTVNGSENQRQVVVQKLTQPDILIYDITNPYEVSEITQFLVSGEEGDYQAVFETSAIENKTYYISALSKIKSPAHTTAWQPTKLKSTKNGADYILITAADFLPAVAPLSQLRRQQGLRVKEVSVEQIYDEFNDGLADPQAIKQFLKYAYDNWRLPVPTYVFLVGDANLNYKNQSNRKPNKVPPYLSPSWEGLTPDDSQYVSVDGDDRFPDLFIGRIPSKDLETVTKLIDKIIRFEEYTGDNPRQVLLVADSDQDFTDLNEELTTYLPVGFTVDKVYLQSYLAGIGSDKALKDEKITQATQDIITSMNQGVMVSNYIGHGVVDRWSGAKGLFKPTDVRSLTNENQLIFALMLTCINGYFVGDKYSLAEEFILADGGAIGSLAPSNVSFLWEDAILANEVFSTLFEQGNRTLGAITTQAKIGAYGRGTSADVIKTFTLFGDPAVTLQDWQ